MAVILRQLGMKIVCSLDNFSPDNTYTRGSSMELQDQLHQVSTYSTTGVIIFWSSSKVLSTRIRPPHKLKSLDTKVIFSSFPLGEREIGQFIGTTSTTWSCWLPFLQFSVSQRAILAHWPYGQHNSHSLSQSQGKNNISPTLHVSEHHTNSQTITGYLNTTTDRESWTLQDRWDWQIHPFFQRINQKWGPPSVDLVASRLAHQLPEYYSWKPDPYAKAMDAFLQVEICNMPILHAQDSLRNQSATSRSDNT